MIHLLKKELNAYFSRPFGFVFLGIFLLLSGVMFTIYNLLGANGNMNGMFDLLKNLSFMIFPILTMRMFSEERRLGTEQLLIRSRLSLTAIVLGKYLAALILFLSALAVTLIYVGIIARFGMPNYGSIAMSYLGFFLLGAAMIAVCMLASSFASNQIMAATASFGILFALVLMNSFVRSIKIPILTPLLSAMAITMPYDAFTMGILKPGPLVYYLATSSLLVFLTVKSLQWRTYR